MIIGALLNAYYGYYWFELIMYIGMTIIFIPLSIFEFTLTAGLAGPEITAVDFKKSWLWFFQVVFFVSHVFLFFGINQLFDFIPKFKDQYDLFSSNYLEAAIPYAAIIYLVILIAGLVYRLVALRKVKLA